MRHLSTLLLALLVGGSLVLSARLWAPDQAVQPPLTGAVRYAAPGTVGDFSAADLAQPWRMLVHFGAVRAAALADPGDPRYIAIWSDVRAALPDLAPPDATATATGAAQCASLAQHARFSLEVDLGQRLPWSAWAAIWGLGAGGAGTAATSPLVDRLLIAPGAAEASICRYAGPAAAQYSVATSPALRRLASDLAALANQPLDYEVVPLGPVAGLALRPGILVPNPSFARGILQVKPESVTPADMLAALFPSGATVRRSAGADGLQSYSDGTAALHIAGDGSLQYAVGLPPSTDTQGPGQALITAAGFVDQAGGWPPTGLLFDLSAIPQPGSFRLQGGEAANTGYRITFTERWRGLPLLGDPPAIAVDVGAPGVLGYTRLVDTAVQEEAPQPFLPAATALGKLAASWPVAASTSDKVVVDVFPAYLRGADGELWLPAWGVELGDGSIVALSATSGVTLDVLRQPGAG
jgi:hypothetical protein